jgi:LysR family transcriptional regulator, mexEF-oprN operon transcriptional activator
MYQIDLRRLDLNLMKAFVVLEQERSVTKSAALLGIGQPAMSHALARLRELAQDELFVRGPGGIVPTARALELAGPIRAALSQIETAFTGRRDFEPGTSTRRFAIGASDFDAAAVLPSLCRALAVTAPRVGIAARNADRTNAAAMIDAHEIDLAIGLFPQISKWHRKADLFEESHVCVFNPRLVKAHLPITLKEFASLPHILVTLRADDRGFVDAILAKRKMKRTIAVTTPYFLLAGYLLHQLPMIATLPRHYAELCAVTSQLAISPLPFATPKFAVSMVWHARDDTSPDVEFLRRSLVDCVGQAKR